MALTKTPVPINFAQGLDTKSDSYQVQVGRFLRLVNSVFDVTNRLTKRNGFRIKTTLPDTQQTTITTLNDSLIATGSNLLTYSEDTDQWIDQGVIQPVSIDTLAMVRANSGQSSPDLAVTEDGLACLVYLDTDGESYYQISDSSTGQQIVPRTLIVGATCARVFLLNRYFIITFIKDFGATYHLSYIAIPIATPTLPEAVEDFAVGLDDPQAGYDGVVANNALYLGWSDASDVNLGYLSSTLIVSSPTVIAGATATHISVTADLEGASPTIWMTYYDSVSEDGFTTAYGASLGGSPVMAPVQTITSQSLNAINSQAFQGQLTMLIEVNNEYGYPTSGVETHYLEKITVAVAGSFVNNGVILRSVGLGSKMWRITEDTTTYYTLAAYGEVNQPTYFLIDTDGNIYARVAPTNGGGYVSNQVLPNITLIDDEYYIPYVIKSAIVAVNKGTNLPGSPPVNGIYSPTGINLLKLNINASGQYSSEIANALHLTGGQTWEYDGVRPVELGFQVYPENIQASSASIGGFLEDQIYYYQFCYEWTDNQGNLHRSAPSIPISINANGGSDTNEITLYVPTLRLTYKVTPNPVRIVGYRWSVAQQIYYQFTSISAPVVNDPSVDYVTIVDTLADSSILGNSILYTTGGVVENNAPAASIHSALFKNRMFYISAEDRNLLGYSKPVVQNTPVEFSDLFTIYVAPTSGAQGSTGDMSAVSAMDDKLIIFKPDAIYYITGDGPDLTGANNNFSEPIFITASVGCDNPESIVLTPNGLMFQSDKGIWLLGRNLETKYIGAAVEQYNDMPVRSAKAIPGTNQIRFILDNNITLMYDYFYDQWGTFTNIRAISSTLYQGLHTYLNNLGQVFQETPGVYLDGSSPVLMSFTTSWISLAGLQGYERFYEMLMLGTYHTPFKLDVQLAYDYKSVIGNATYTPTPEQSVIVTPDNYNPPWGGEALWGSGEVWGGPANVFEARVFPEKQKCETFQVTVNEIYDSTYGVAAGQGLSLSGLNLIVGVKKGSRTSTARRSFG